MAFNYTAGITTAGAPDEIVDWFATFQAWVVMIGWTVESVVSPTELILRSTGEAGGLTMLWIRIWRVGAGDTIRMEVRDDLAGTHETNEAGILDSGGAQFPFWMWGDKDAIVLCFKEGANYHTIYAGMVLPFALTVPDETYRMIATSTPYTCSILRDSGGVWDVDQAMSGNITALAICRFDRFDGSLPLGGTFAGAGTLIAGQLSHVSYPINDPSVNVMDTLETGRPGATTTWIVLEDGGVLFAARTGGVLPTGSADPGTFVSSTGIVANYPALWVAIEAHMVGLGWVNLGDTGYMDAERLFFSAGESGLEEIFCGFALQLDLGPGEDRLHSYVQSDAIGTNRAPTTIPLYMDAAEFPVNYWIGGDADCVYLVLQTLAGYNLMWSGLVPAFAPGLLPPYPGGVPLSEYQTLAVRLGRGIGLVHEGRGLRGHDGLYPEVIYFYSDGFPSLNSNPNAFDGTTYLLWPFLASTLLVVGPFDAEIWGQLRYVGFTDGGGVANLDTITIAGQVYTAFFDSTGDNFCVRTT